jgi:hypothetical protein
MSATAGANPRHITRASALLVGIGVVYALLGSIRRRVAIALGIGELLLIAAGLGAIRFASSLNRPERPPYIMVGLLALGITMACAYPIVTAIRRREILPG